MLLEMMDEFYIKPGVILHLSHLSSGQDQLDEHGSHVRHMKFEY
jgi:hypothetical protein